MQWAATWALAALGVQAYSGSDYRNLLHRNSFIHNHHAGLLQVPVYDHDNWNYYALHHTDYHLQATAAAAVDVEVEEVGEFVHTLGHIVPEKFFLVATRKNGSAPPNGILQVCSRPVSLILLLFFFTYYSYSLVVLCLFFFLILLLFFFIILCHLFFIFFFVSCYSIPPISFFSFIIIISFFLTYLSL